MTIECRCPGCGGRFRVADEAAGRRVKCPQCGAVIPVLAPSAPPPNLPPTIQKPAAPPRPATVAEPFWFVRTVDDRQHGPMAKGQLDQLVAQGRLDAFCEVRRADWDEWRMIDEVYPSLAIGGGDNDLRLIGQRQPPEPSTELNTLTRRQREPQKRTPFGIAFTATWGVLIGIVTFSLLSLLVSVLLISGCLVGSFRSVPPPVQTAPPSRVERTPPPVPSLSAQQIAKCKDEVAAALARQVDDANRMKHDVMTALPQLGDYAEALKMAQEMADPRSKPSKEEDKPQSPKPKPEPYQSQFETLQRECRAYLDAHVQSPVDREETIWSVGREWVKMRSPEQQLLENLLQPNATTPKTP